MPHAQLDQIRHAVDEMIVEKRQVAVQDIVSVRGALVDDFVERLKAPFSLSSHFKSYL